MIDSEKFIFGTLLHPVLQLCCILHIHPNVITLSSVITSVLLLHFHNTHQFNYVIYMIIYKWLSDGLDGEVARKCNKTSVIGGILDTFSDEFFFMIIFKILLSFYIKNNDILWIIIILFFKLFQLLYIHHYGFDVMYDHEILKRKSKNKYEKIYSFCVNNCLIIYILIIILYYYLSHKNNTNCIK